jgi:histidyl-tRNA synthetase
MAQKPSIPKGTRDFSPQDMAKRNYIFDTIRKAFRLFGYSQIETPAMENLSTLMGKYGEEGDKLLFKILNSGDFMKSVSSEYLEEKNLNKLTKEMCEKGLRYDLTVPFARYVVQHRGELQFPFKRFQIQPVWRADRPQKGRYREFYQCDADIIGSESLLNEIELLSLIDTVFASFGIRIAIKVNNRKILSAIAEVVDASDKLIDITVAIDKLDKIGWGNVCQELLDKGLSQQAIDKLSPLLEFKGSNDDKIDALEKMVGSTEIGRKGIDELKEVISGIDTLGHKCGVEIDITLARGLNYYTGTILEVKALDVEIGSITGGGRYDNLTGVFGMPGVSGVGISFGADRIYDVLNQLNLYPDEISESVKVMFLNLGKDEAMQSAKAIKVLQDNGIAAKLYPDIAKMKKQMGIADSEKIPYIAIIGSDELTDNSVTLKDMKSGEQKRIPLNTLVENLK